MNAGGPAFFPFPRRWRYADERIPVWGVELPRRAPAHPRRLVGEVTVSERRGLAVGVVECFAPPCAKNICVPHRNVLPVVIGLTGELENPNDTVMGTVSSANSVTSGYVIFGSRRVSGSLAAGTPPLPQHLVLLLEQPELFLQFTRFRHLRNGLIGRTSSPPPRAGPRHRRRVSVAETDRRTRRTRPAGRAGPHGHQEARQDPRRRRLEGSRPRSVMYCGRG